MSLFDEFDAQEAQQGKDSLGGLFDEFDRAEGTSGAASALARRRWEKLTGLDAIASRDKAAPPIDPAKVEQERQFGRILSGQRNVFYETDPTEQAKIDARMNAPQMRGLVMGNPVTPQDEPSTLKRAAKNIPASLEGAVTGAGFFLPQLAAHPVELTKETVNWVKDAFKALSEGAALNVISHYQPVMGAQLRAQGWTDEALRQQFGDDPVGFVSALGMPVAAVAGIKGGGKKAGRALDRVNPTPRAGDFGVELPRQATTEAVASVKKRRDIQQVIDDAQATVELWKFEREQNRPRTFESENADMRAADRARIIAGRTPQQSPLVEGTPIPPSPPILSGPKPKKQPIVAPAKEVVGQQYDPVTGLPIEAVVPSEPNLSVVGPTPPFNDPGNLRRGTMGPPQGRVRGEQAPNTPPSPQLYGPTGGPSRGKGGVVLGTGLGGAQDALSLKKVKEIVEQARIGNWSRRQIDESLKASGIDPTQFDDAIKTGRGERAPDLPLNEPDTPLRRDATDLLDQLEQRKGELQQQVFNDDPIVSGQAATQLADLLDHEGRLKDVLESVDTTDLDARITAAQDALAKRLGKIGTALQSGGLGDIPGVSKALFEVAYWQARKLTRIAGTLDFDTWAREVRKIANDERVPLTDDALTAIWNSSTFDKEFKTPPTLQQTANSTAQALEQGVIKTGADDLVDTHTTSMMRDWAARRLGPNNPLGIDVMNYADSIGRGIREIVDTQFWTLPRMGDVAKRIPRMVDSATRFITSKGHAFVISREHFDRLSTHLNVNNRLGRLDKEASKSNRNLFADLLEDDRARALEVRGIVAETRRTEITTTLEGLNEQASALKKQRKAVRRTNDLKAVEAIEKEQRRIDREIANLVEERDQLPQGGYGRYRKMADQTRSQALARPDIQAAINYYRTTIMPEMAALSTDVGIQARLVGPLGTYIRMKPVLDLKEANSVGRDRAPQTYGITASPGAQSPFNVRPRRSASRNRATGQAPEGMVYENDLFKMLNNTFEDRFTVKSMQDLRAMVEEHSLGTVADFEGRHEALPITTKVGNRQEPIVRLTLERVKGPADTTYLVPESVAYAYRLATDPLDSRVVKAFDTLKNAMTAQLLILPAEAVVHGLGIVQAVHGIEFYKKHGHTARVAEAMSGLPGKVVSLLYRGFKLEGAELAAMIRSGAEHGGLRLSGMERTTEQRSLVMALGQKVPGLHGLKELVFGHPGSSMGFKGLETRARIVIFMGIKESKPHLSDMAAWRHVNDAWGTYVRKLTPALADNLTAVYPFARARTALSKTGVRTLLSRDITGKFNPYVALNVASTLAAATLLSASLDDKKRFFWQIPGGKPLDIRFEYDGKIVTIPARLVANSIYRGMQTTGLQGTVNALLAGDNTDGVKAAHLESLFNYGASFSGPVIGAGSALTTGSVPYRMGGSFLQVAKPSMTGAPEGKITQQTKATLKQVLPLYAKGAEAFDPTGKEVRPEGTVPNALYFLAELFGVAPKIENAATAELRAQSGLQRRAQAEWSDVAISIASEANRLPEDQRAPFIMEQVEKRTTDTLVPSGMGGNLMPAKYAVLQLALKLAATQEGRLNKAAAMQDVNYPNDMWQEFDQQEAVAGGGQ